MTYPASVMDSVVSYLEGEGMNAMADAVQELKAENERLRGEVGKLRALLKTQGWLSDRANEQTAGQGDPQMGN